MEDNLKKKMEDDLNFKAVLLRLFNNKNPKTPKPQNPIWSFSNGDFFVN